MPVTYEEATGAVHSGAYTKLSDAELIRLLNACSGERILNPVAQHQIDYATTMLRRELDARESRAMHRATRRVAWLAVIAATGALVLTLVLWIIDHLRT